MKHKTPKIVFFDLETLPDPREIYDRIPSIGAWPGRTFKADLQSIMCFGYKIKGQKKAKSINAWDFKESWERDRHDDSALIQAAYDILHDADEIVTHNGKKFDVKVLNTRLAYYGLPPIAKTPHVDTRQVAKRHLTLYSNSLDAVAKFFGCSKKMHWSNKWNTWTKIAFREESKKDLKLMDKYCKQDVEVLEDVYEHLRPFHGNQGTNKNHFVDGDVVVCHSCGSDNLIGHGYRQTTTQLYPRFRCKDCGSVTSANKKGQKGRPA